MNKRVLVCGGRDFNDRDCVHSALNAIRPSCIIEGGAEGADALAADWADSHDVEKQTFKADWKAHGRAAGPIRNKQMLDEGRPSLVIAFPGGRGTADMVRRARRADIPVLEIEGVEG